MATTDVDGTNLMLLREGTLVTLVLGDKSYMGTLLMRKEGVQESWYIKLDAAEPGAGEIEIHSRKGAVTITDADAEKSKDDPCTHESIAGPLGSEYCLKCGTPFV